MCRRHLQNPVFISRAGTVIVPRIQVKLWHESGKLFRHRPIHSRKPQHVCPARDRSFDGSRFIPLDEALEQRCVIVHETGNVGQLEIENLSDVLDLYVQAGDVVKGGRQDRTLGVDFVLPAKSGRTPVPSFCVESGRWRSRASEDVHSSSSSKSYLASKKLRMAAKMSKSQADRAAGGRITGIRYRMSLAILFSAKPETAHSKQDDRKNRVQVSISFRGVTVREEFSSAPSSREAPVWCVRHAHYPAPSFRGKCLHHSSGSSHRAIQVSEFRTKLICCKPVVMRKLGVRP